jgi:two-component system, NtrC family, nitrogen regulation sensor histidine kinase NtrY
MKRLGGPPVSIDIVGWFLDLGSVMTSAEEAAPAELAAVAATPTASVATGVLGPIAVAIALLSALATFLVLAGLTPIRGTGEVVLTLLLFSASAGLLLLGIIGREIWLVVQARRRGRAGARLHIQIVALFSIIAAAPTILVAVVASIAFDRGLDASQFATRAVIQNFLIVADAYLAQNAQMIRGEVMAMAFDLARAKPVFDQDREKFRQLLTAQATFRGLPGAMIIDGERAVIEKAEVRNQQDVLIPSPQPLANVSDTEPQIDFLTDANSAAAVVTAAIKLRGYDNTYLYVAHPLDPRVFSQLKETRSSIGQYSALEERRPGVQLAFALMYTVIALTVLLSAAWLGLNFANRLVAPIRRLIGAANVVSRGNLYVQVPVRPSEGDLAQLGETFNKMTQELRTQRDDIVRARDLVDSRRRFTEAVLAGASAGVIRVDADGHISILNRSAEKLIGRTEAEALGKPLTEVVPELAPMMSEAQQAGVQRLVQGQITIGRGNDERSLSVRVTTEQSADPTHGYVVTLDDITELVSAQRTSAWADVARRIAHEIKNPLTPIQLSAERLRRKYSAVIKEDRTVFERCTDTIVRQVDDIRRMVDEFSRFARMPKPVMAPEDVADTVRQAVFLMRVGNADIDIEADISEDPMTARFDRRLISQGLTNIIKNATEAIAAVPPAEIERGKVHVSATRDNGNNIIIDIVDNGIGLPKENRRRLLEPYVTTREKGTGLGLAIVGKILEEHGGRIELHDAAEKTPGARGAWIRMLFAADPITNSEADTRKAAGER